MSFGLNSFKQQGSKQEEIELEKKLLEGDILRLTKVGIYELVIEKIALSVITFTNKENVQQAMVTLKLNLKEKTTSQKLFINKILTSNYNCEGKKDDNNLYYDKSKLTPLKSILGIVLNNKDLTNEELISYFANEGKLGVTGKTNNIKSYVLDNLVGAVFKAGVIHKIYLNEDTNKKGKYGITYTLSYRVNHIFKPDTNQTFLEWKYEKGAEQLKNCTEEILKNNVEADIQGLDSRKKERLINKFIRNDYDITKLNEVNSPNAQIKTTSNVDLF